MTTYHWCDICRLELPLDIVQCPVCATQVHVKKDNRIGARVENYIIQQRLAIGGMSSVYLGEHQLLHHRVAIKLMKHAFTQDAFLVERFIREAKACCSIAHPGIPQIHECGQLADGTLFIVMDYIQGPTISQVLVENGTLPWIEATIIANQVCEVLQVAHQQNMIHRDLKPANVMLVYDQDAGVQAKVLDFGIAKLLTARPITLTGDIVGTPEYLAPEQALGKAVDARADIYAVGILLYSMLTGTLPFFGDNNLQIMQDHISETPEPPRLRRPDIQMPEEIEQVVMMCLEKQPQDRYQCAEELAEDLTHVLFAEPLTHTRQKALIPRQFDELGLSVSWKMDLPSWIAKSMEHHTTLPFARQVALTQVRKRTHESGKPDVSGFEDQGRGVDNAPRDGPAALGAAANEPPTVRPAVLGSDVKRFEPNTVRGAGPGDVRGFGPNTVRAAPGDIRGFGPNTVRAGPGDMRGAARNGPAATPASWVRSAIIIMMIILAGAIIGMIVIASR